MPYFFLDVSLSQSPMIILNRPLSRCGQYLIHSSKVDAPEVFVALLLNDILRKTLSSQSCPLQCLH